MSASMPTLFVSHGAPTLVIDNVPTRDFLLNLGKSLPRPKAILAVSAHWDTFSPRLSTHPAPHTMYDFYGFPDALYEMHYPASGAVEVAQQAAKLLEQASIPVDLDPQRGLDHGAWVPLKLMYPEADIPVAQLSIQSGRSTEHHLAMGRALAPLREQGVLILASGNATHNLRDVFRHPLDAPPAGYAKSFADWLAARIVARDETALADYLNQGPQAERNHPSPDHYLPLLVAAGAGCDDHGQLPGGRLLHNGYTYGVLSMAAYAWG